MNHASIVPLLEKGRALIRQHVSAVVSFDFQHVASLDSSAVALLLDWCRLVKAEGKTIQFVNLPDRLLSLIQISELSDILPIGDNDH